VVFIVNASTPEEAKNILEKFPLGQGVPANNSHGRRET